MKRVIFPFVAILIIESAAVCRAQAVDDPEATASAFVESLRTVLTGDTLLVRLKHGNSTRGKFHAVHHRELELSRGQKIITISETDVQKVYRLEKKSAGLRAAIGGVIGLGAFLVGHALALPKERAPTHSADASLIAYSGGIGALVGWVIGKRARRRVLLYDAGLAAITSDTGGQRP